MNIYKCVKFFDILNYLAIKKPHSLENSFPKELNYWTYSFNRDFLIYGLFQGIGFLGIFPLGGKGRLSWLLLGLTSKEIPFLLLAWGRKFLSGTLYSGNLVGREFLNLFYFAEHSDLPGWPFPFFLPRFYWIYFFTRMGLIGGLDRVIITGFGSSTYCGRGPDNHGLKTYPKIGFPMYRFVKRD